MPLESHSKAQWLSGPVLDESPAFSVDYTWILEGEGEDATGGWVKCPKNVANLAPEGELAAPAPEK